MIIESDFISYITVKKALSEQSIRHCKSRLKVINRWLSLNNKELNNQTVEELFYWLRIDKHLAGNSLNTYVFCLRYIEDYLKDRGHETALLDGIKRFPKQRIKTIEVLTTQEIEKLLSVHINYKHFNGQDCSHLDGVYRTFMMGLAFTGARFDEMASLRVKDVDLSWKKITFVRTKNKETRSVYITEPLLSNIGEQIKGKDREDYVFTSMTGSKLITQNVSRDLQMRKKLAHINKRIHPHLFRHSFATQLLQSGVEITQVAAILGHKDIQTTFENYVHLADETLKKAMYHHPLIRRHIEPTEFIKNIKGIITGFHIDEDYRFDYEINEKSGELQFKIRVKNDYVITDENIVSS